ncbi:hypothetical protein KIW84_012105 [Lathyrus oleraceus]|uniref:Uncharacterized protein n=1 Tax=Pisum sativum TaxID=3888 RepID=A0A9D5BGS4_PEA|nr:hypothetical protein KIW84_012105 [Pisum sativum]
MKFLSNLDQIKSPGLHPSMSIEDLVNHIGHCITKQMGPENSNFASDRAKLEEFTQYLFNDSEIQPTSDEQNVMSRVNSSYNLIRKDPNSHPKLSSKPKPLLSLVCDRINGLGLICEFVFVSSEGGDECLKQRRGFEGEVIILTVCWCFIWISSRL